MKNIKEYLHNKHKGIDTEYWTKENYLLANVQEFYGDDIPEHIKEKLLNDEYVDYIYENLKSHDVKKLQYKLKKEYGNKIRFQNYLGDIKKSFLIIPVDNDVSFFIDNEKINNILSFYNYYLSYSDNDNGRNYLFIEPRYSDKVSDEIYNSHKYIYHFTDKLSAKSILETGLRIKNRGYREFPERIFLYATDKKIEDDKENIYKFILKVCNRKRIKEYGISVLRIKNDGKIDFYNDTAMDEKEAIFSYENIPYQYISKNNIDIKYEDLFK